MIDGVELLVCFVFSLFSIFAIALFWYDTNSLLIVHGKLIASRAFDCPNAFGIQSFQIHKSFFVVFYIFGFFSNLLPLYFLEFSSSVKIIPFVLVQLHYLRRILECFFVHTYSRNSSMNLGHLFVGLCHYLLFEISFLTNYARGSYNPYFVAIGAFLFVVSSIGQFLSHISLLELKSNDLQWKYPQRNRLFKYIFCPHYFFEVIIYVSFWFLNSLSLPFFYAFVWTLANLSISAANTIEWYSENFPTEHAVNQAKFKRWAIIPFLI
ncbi:3-oxo-5-alpha-steroid 4-dehydrogenase [Mitosporidium daphniae]